MEKIENPFDLVLPLEEFFVKIVKALPSNVYGQMVIDTTKLSILREPALPYPSVEIYFTHRDKSGETSFLFRVSDYFLADDIEGCKQAVLNERDRILELFEWEKNKK